jgi:RNA polymerase subunit RPABC4/transcription elongation factor Spt4
MSTTPSSQPPVSQSVAGAVPAAILPNDTLYHRPAPVSENTPDSAQLGPRRIGYGLPCVRCKTYYAADLSACPVCKTEERVQPMPVVANSAAARTPELAVREPDDIALEEERERFLGEFKAMVYESDGQIDGQIDGESVAPVAVGCNLESNHQGAFEPATVCQPCYARLQQRLDLMEAALHIDLKEATQVIYDAVWSDPSDPSKTYHNAAKAFLTELHRRAGIPAVLGRNQSLAH